MLSKVFVALLTALSVSAGSSFALAQNNNNGAPSVLVRPAARHRLPVAHVAEAEHDGIDSNSPLHWDDGGRLHIFASIGHPFRSSGPHLFQLSTPMEAPRRVNVARTGDGRGRIWLEATYRDTDGRLFGWYHNEIGEICAEPRLTMPRIGALVSLDDGLNWQDLGLVLEAPRDALNCDSRNNFFAGGNGDFSVVLDRAREYFYFFFGTYHKQPGEQGIAAARMRYAERLAPAGNVWKWHDGQWSQPGLGGRVTPIFPVLTDWHRDDANALWGPAVHYNTYLNTFVMLLNHAVDKYWRQEGVYVSYNRDPANPRGWSTPLRLPLDPEGRAYPQMIGLAPGETDKQLGQSGRLYLLGESFWELIFLRPGETGLQYAGGAPVRRSAPADQRRLPARTTRQ